MGAPSDPTTYDEQIGMTFTQSFTSMAYNVTAVEQSDPSSGYGPAYLLNGLSDSGYWYQVGLSWNWDGTGTYSNYSPGFNLNYEVFDSSGNSIFPTSGYGGVQGFSGPVYAGDTVGLSLYFSSTYGVMMLAKDYNTGSTSYQTYSAEGGSQFVGLSGAPANSNGFFTGLMTEWYHSSAFYGNITPVIYSNPHYALGSAWMWIDEFSCPDTSCSNRSVLFSDATSGPVSYSNPIQLQEFSSNGATEFSDAYELITGPAYWSLTVSYSVNGGGSGYAAPTFTYAFNGASQSASLTRYPVTYSVDVGSTWSITGTLGGSNQTVRWSLTNPQTSGVATSSQTIIFVYQLQYRLFVTGGSGGADGDGWYDSGSIAVASSSGVYARSGGSGERVNSYSVDGVVTQVTPSVSTIEVSVVMNASHQVAFASTKQYEISLGEGATMALNSITPPTISGDQYWYDAGSQVSLTLNGAWGRASGEGARLVSYSVNGGIPIQVNTTGIVTVIPTEPISSPESVATLTIAQYQLMTPTGIVTSVTSPTIGGDTGWYDAGTSVSVTYNNAWDITPSQSRIVAVGYSVNGGSVTLIPQSGNGTFVVSIVMDGPQTINIKSTTQYYTSFKFTDASGLKTITPTDLQIVVNGETQDVKGFSVWLDNGTAFTVSKLVYEGVDVRPPSETQYSVTGPSQVTLKALIYDATLKVTDFLGLPVSGAKVSLTLVNGTTITGLTGGDGTFVAPGIPLGNFSGTVSNLGSTVKVIGDASKESVTAASVPFSSISLGLVVVLVLVAAGVSTFVLRMRSKSRTVQLTGVQAPRPSTSVP
jgi:hypothetical protein